ncbi:MAG: hypothetical protein ACRC0X_03770 [Brevinema sp.]
MKKLFLLLLATSACSLVSLETTMDNKDRLRYTNPAYKSFQNAGIWNFNYSTSHGKSYWMWASFKPSSSDKITVVACVKAHGNNKRKFIRRAVDVVYHTSPSYNNEFIIDFGKDYDDLLSRYMYVQKTSRDSFRGKMLSYIKWDNNTDFEFRRASSYPEATSDSAYDDVVTYGEEYILDSNLPFGEVPAFDVLRNNDIVSFNYKTEGGVSYYMWLDLRIGVDNYMQMIYHKPEIKNIRFFSGRRIFNLFYNPDNTNEFLIDLGVANGSIPRYIYVLKTGRNAFRGKMTNTPYWGQKTEFQLTKSSLSYYDRVSVDYDSVVTDGSIEPYSDNQAGQNPRNYAEALTEAVSKIDGVDGFSRISSSYTESGEGTVIKTQRKEFYIKYDEKQNQLDKVKFIWTTEYNGRSGSTLFAKYFGERTAVKTLTMIKINDPMAYISYKGNGYHAEWLTQKGYEWYHSYHPFAMMVTNFALGSDNIWRTVNLHPNELFLEPINTDFLIKKVSNDEYIILDFFQTKYQSYGPTVEIIEEDFDIDNPSKKYRYKIN